jgi:hypothetical protein
MGFADELAKLLEQRLPPEELEAKAIELRKKYGLPILKDTGTDQFGRPLPPRPPSTSDKS